MTGKTLRKSVVGTFFGLLLATGAQAANVLLYSDLDNFGNSNWEQALVGQTVTQTSSDASFNSTLSLGGFDLVVVQFNADLHPDVKFGNYLTSGGKMIFSHWDNELDKTVGANQVAANETTLTVTSDALSAGLSSRTQTLSFDTEGTFTRTFAGSTSLASFGSGSGIIRNGNIIINGFVGDTFARSSDEVQLYKNEVNLLLAPVPEPEFYVMLLVGLGLMGFIARRRKEKSLA